MSKTVEIQTYCPAWQQIADAEQRMLGKASGHVFVALEHIGSTAVPGLAAKPIIDLMAAVECLADIVACVPSLRACGFEQVATSKPQRLLLRKAASISTPQVHLHVVEATTWEERDERLFRDFLRSHPERATAYAALKRQLAVVHADNLKAYTCAKTGFVQSVVVAARDTRGVPRREAPVLP